MMTAEKEPFERDAKEEKQQTEASHSSFPTCMKLLCIFVRDDPGL
jgi:hypothetical protein